MKHQEHLGIRANYLTIMYMQHNGVSHTTAPTPIMLADAERLVQCHYHVSLRQSSAFAPTSLLASEAGVPESHECSSAFPALMRLP